MYTIGDIEKAIENLPPEGLAEFRAWFAQFDAGHWDSQFEGHVSSGKLEQLASAALEDFAKGRCKDL